MYVRNCELKLLMAYDLGVLLVYLMVIGFNLFSVSFLRKIIFTIENITLPFDYHESICGNFDQSKLKPSV